MSLILWKITLSSARQWQILLHLWKWWVFHALMLKSTFIWAKFLQLLHFVRCNRWVQVIIFIEKIRLRTFYFKAANIDYKLNHEIHIFGRWNKCLRLFYALVLVVGIYFKSFELTWTEKVNLHVFHTKYNFVRIDYYKSYVLAVFS